METNIRTKSQMQAFTFLCRKNMASNLDIEHSDYVFMLMDFEEIHGPQAIENLAGFYLYMIRHKTYTPQEKSKAILEVFAHDLYDRKKECMEPRSSRYGKYWEEEHNNYQY